MTTAAPATVAFARPALAVTTRPRAAGDEAHLREVFAATRADEVAGWGWPGAAVRAFLVMQFDARERSLAGLDDRVVEVHGVPAGRLVLDESGPALRLVDMALLPEFRGAGLGGELLARLCARADAEGRSIELHVLGGSPVVGLYQRWGFAAGAPEGVYQPMTRPPGGRHE